MMNEFETYKFIKEKILNAKKTHSIQLMCEVSGMVDMAGRLNGITAAQYIELYHIVRGECLHNPEWMKDAML